MAVTIDEIQVKFGAEITELQKRLDTVEGEVKKTEKSTNNLNKAFKAAGAAIIAAFSVDTLIRFGRQVISVTAEFQRLEAQLTTALGSQSAAQRAMQDIVDFAARTPFQVTQLTEAFVGFANRGVKPSIAQMENLGDLAAALGKDFDLLSGAIIDAVDPMRWRNLGIVVTREGDKMTGSFKGLEVTVDATTEGALEMAAAFGQMEGVAGGMARVSDTLGGKISNLNDNLDVLFATIGAANNGVLVTFIDRLNQSIATITDLIKGNKQLGKEMGMSSFSKMLEQLNIQIENFTSQEQLTTSIDKVTKQLIAERKNLETLQRRLAIETEQMGTIGAGQGTQRQKRLRLNLTEQLVSSSQTQLEQLTDLLDDLMKTEIKVSKVQTNNEKERIDNRQKINLELAKTQDLLQQMEGLQEPQLPAMTLMGIDSEAVNPLLEPMNQALLVTDALDGAMNALFSTLASGGNIFEAFGNYLKQLAARLAAMAATAAILNVLSGGSGALAGGITSMFGQGAGFGGILSQLLGLGGDRAMASGGIAYGPTRALIGEYPGARSNPEVVAPLNKLQGMLGGMGMNGNVTFRIEGNSLVGVLDRSNRQRFRTS